MGSDRIQRCHRSGPHGYHPAQKEPNGRTLSINPRKRTDMKTITYLHNCNSGDLICALPGMREIYRKYGKKAIICQVLDMPGHYMPGLIHSVKNETGVQVTFNQKMFDMMRPLLLAQEYIEDFQIYTDQTIDID